MLRIILLLSVFTLPLFGQKDGKQNVFTNANDAAKMAMAKQKIYAGDYISALNAYREVEKGNPENAQVNYYLGLCYLQLQQLDNAEKSLEKAVQAKDAVPESHLLLGRVYQNKENFDKAIETLTRYNGLSNKDSEMAPDGNLYLMQCQNAKKYMTMPLDVKITNMGENINSKWDDKNPCITADAKRLVFTTRRPESTNAETDVEGDGKYFENIYIANIDSLTGQFSKAVAVSNNINIKAHDAVTSISADGKQIFIYYNDTRNKEKHGGNVFVSKVNNGKWKVPEDLGKPINSSYWEGGVCVSPDGKKYFFTSERPGGYGRSDIWMVERKNKKEWSKPVNMGPEINSPHDEGGMFLAPDGKTLFFCSNGEKSMGGYDIFRTVFENGKWSSPENIGFPINTPAKEGQITVSADAKYAYFSSNRSGGLGESDLYVAELSGYAVLEKDGKKKNTAGLGILKGTIREGGEGYGVAEVEVSINDGQGKNLVSTLTNEAGEYFLTIPAGQYELVVRKKNYVEVKDAVLMPLNDKETPSVEKGYLIKKL